MKLFEGDSFLVSRQGDPYFKQRGRITKFRQDRQLDVRLDNGTERIYRPDEIDPLVIEGEYICVLFDEDFPRYRFSGKYICVEFTGDVADVIFTGTYQSCDFSKAKNANKARYRGRFIDCTGLAGIYS
jgi:hypothetical protein